MGYRKRNDDEESDVLRRMHEQIPPVGSHKAGVPSATLPDPDTHPPIDTPEQPSRTRSTQEESAEMSPVIYRPSGPDPDRDPAQDPAQRTSLAGPGTPTASEFTDDATVAASLPLEDDVPHRADRNAFDEGLDDDPEISEEELVDEAEDALLDDLEEVQPEFDHEPSLASEDVTTPVPPPVPQRSRRRIFGHHDDPEQSPEPDEQLEAPEVAERPTNAEAHHPVRRRRIRPLHISAPPQGPPTDPDPTDPDLPDPDLPDSEIPEPEVDEPGLGGEEIPSLEIDQPEADEPAVEAPAPALRGHVASTRGRGLSGMTVTVLGTTGDAVTSTVTGRRGRYSIPQLTAGTYWVVASDTVDGDFNDGTYDDHAPIEVQDGHSLEGIDVRQIGRVAIAAAIDAGPEGSIAEITVLDRSTGMPAKGSITVTTEHFGTDLALNRGRARISVPGEDLGGRLRIEYSGSRHNAAAKRTVRVR